MSYEYITYAEIQNLELEALSFDKKQIYAIFKHKTKPEVKIGVKRGRMSKATEISYPANVSAMQAVIRDLEVCAEEIVEKLE